jgi:hypothetical protein
MLYSIEENAIVGRVALGKRTPKGWVGQQVKLSGAGLD